MHYVWDPTKDVLNQRNHHLSLADGIPALEDPDCQSWSDTRFDYEEDRVISLGRNKRSILLVVSIEQDEEEDATIRILSVRKATRNEESWYYFGRP
jgi:uncharacterized DUF497 family protein